MMHRFLTFAFLIILTACQDGQSDAEQATQQMSADSEKIVASVENAKEDLPEGYETIRKHCPDMDDETIKGILKPSSPNRPDYDFYAREYCVSHEEARRRLALQGEWHTGDTGIMVQELITRIQLEERDSFAGHWIQHTPDYALAVAFTKDAKKTLAKYTENPIFVAVDIPGTDERTIDRNFYGILAMMEKLEIPYSSANRDHKSGTLKIQLSIDKEDYIRSLAAKGQIDLPEWVQFTTPPPLPKPIPEPAIEPKLLKAFPHYNYRREFEMRTSMGVADRVGMLRLKNGCLAFEKEGETKNIMWQKYHAPDLTDPQRVGVMSRYKGSTVYTGEEIILSGLQPGIVTEVDGKNNNPESWAKVAEDTSGACPPPYVMVERFTSSEELRKTKQNAQTKEYMKTFKMSREEALKQVKKAEVDNQELVEFIQNVQKTRRDIIAGASAPRGAAFSAVYAGYGTNILPPRASIFVKGDIDKASIIPLHLMESVNLQSVPRSLEDGDKDIAFLKYKLGGSAEFRFEPIDGAIYIYKVTDLKPLSDLRVNMGDNWPEHYKIPIQHQSLGSIYYGPTSMQERHELQESPQYQAVMDYAESKFLKHDYMRIDGAVLSLFNQGLVKLDKIKRLEQIGYGPLTAELDYQSESRKLKDAIYAEAIVTAEVIDIDTSDDRNDGYRSTVTFRVKDYIKGPLLPDQSFKVRLRSGEEDKFGHIKIANEPFLLPGFDYSFAESEDWILFISNRAYETKTRDRDSTAEPLWIMSGRAMPRRESQYPWFGQALSPAQMREQIKGMDTPENLIAYVNNLPRPHKGVCNIQPGVPEEGLGVYHEDSDVYNLSLTFKDQSLGCDHEGPQNQQCHIESGGYITWMEEGQRRHIRAEGGYVDVVLTHGLGARCNE